VAGTTASSTRFSRNSRKNFTKDLTFADPVVIISLVANKMTTQKDRPAGSVMDNQSEPSAEASDPMLSAGVTSQFWEGHSGRCRQGCDQVRSLTIRSIASRASSRFVE
jgi:hypothetical protein